MSNQRTVLRVANKESSANVAAREIRAHVEFTGISRRCGHLSASSQPEFMAVFRCSRPADELAGVRSVLRALEFARSKSYFDGGKSVPRHLRFAATLSRRC